MSDETLNNLLQVGKSIRVDFGHGSSKEVRYIRAIVDNDQIVYRVWSKVKQRWVYHVDSRYAFYLIRTFLKEAK